ncbi:MAG: hypothetical protein EOP84_34785 [Verrucomicrobiaceae bacterium]|nr:MAG: hypothetical protein EOP84_34785 [Verrucomicrobiaceae bacterium]
MTLPILLFVALLLYGMAGTHFSVRRSKSERERSAALRFAVFTWLLGIMMVVLLFLPIPGKQRILMLAPMLFLGFVVRRVLKSARNRIRAEEQLEVNIERMKRVN